MTEKVCAEDCPVIGTRCPLDEAKVLQAYRLLKMRPGGGKLSIRVKVEGGKKYVDVEEINNLGRSVITE